MSARLSREQRTYYTRKMLQRIQRELSKANVGTIYKRGTPQTSAHLVYDGTGITGGFQVTMSWDYMSNGESVGTPRIWVLVPGTKPQVFAGWSGQLFEMGMEHIKNLFAKSSELANAEKRAPLTCY
jgi:hypothetical protein